MTSTSMALARARSATLIQALRVSRSGLTESATTVLPSRRLSSARPSPSERLPTLVRSCRPQSAGEVEVEGVRGIRRPWRRVEGLTQSAAVYWNGNRFSVNPLSLTSSKADSSERRECCWKTEQLHYPRTAPPHAPSSSQQCLPGRATHAHRCRSRWPLL